MVSLSGRSEKARGLNAQNRERFEHSSRGTCSVPLLSALSSALPPYSHAEPSAPPVRPPSRALPLLPASPTSPAGPVFGLALKFRFRFPPAGPNDRQPRRRRCSRGCSPAPHPPGRRAATPWQVWGAGGVTWRRCRGLRPPREGRVRWNNHLGPSELPPGSPFGWVAEAGLVLPWASASSSPQESCGAALCGSGQNARVLRAQ